MAYPGDYRRDQLGEDGYAEGGYNDREYYKTEGYGRESYGGSSLPLFGEQYEHHKHWQHHRPGYQPEGYSSRPVEYVETQASDLGMGLRDSDSVANSDYGAGCGSSQLGYGVPGYGSAGYAHGKVERLEEELEHERKRRHEAEAAAAAATAYAAHERHEKKKFEEELERYETKAEHRYHHSFFSYD